MNDLYKIKIRRTVFVAAFTAVLFLLIVLVQALAPARGLMGRYFANSSWSEPAVLTRVDSRISFDKRVLGEAAGIPERFSVRWEGYVYIPKSGSYPFSVTSDDGAWIAIDDRPVVDNGGNHAATTARNEIPLSRGSHRILVKYFDDGGDALIDVPVSKFRFYPTPASSGRYFADVACSAATPVLKAGLGLSVLVLVWFGLGILWILFRASVVPAIGRRFNFPKILLAARKKIAYFFVLVTGLGLALWAAARLTPVHGLTGTYYANPSFDGDPVAKTIDKRVRFQTEDIAKKVGTEDFSSVLWEGYFHVSRAAFYRFSITSDDGSWVYIDDALAVDNGGTHAAINKQNTVSLTPGSHKILIKYFDAGGGALVDFSWTTAGGLPLLRRPLFLYPQPPRPGVAFADIVLFYLKIGLVVCLSGAATILILLLPGFLSPALDKLGRWEHAVYSGLDGFLNIARRRNRALAISAGVLVVLALAARVLAPDRGLIGTYFSNESWQGPPESHVLDHDVRLQKREMSARAGDSDVFSVVWEGFVYIPLKSTYLFSVGSDDGSWVYLDDKLLIDNGGRHGIRTLDKDVELDRGNHKILIKYFDAGGDGQIVFRAKETKAPVWRRPRVFLSPKPADPKAYFLNLVASVVRAAEKPLLLIFAVLLGLMLVRKVRPRGSLQPVLVVIVFLVLAGRYETELFRDKSISVRGCDYYAYLHGADLMARNGFLRTEFTDPLISRIHKAFETAPATINEIFFLSPHGYYVYDLDKGLVYNVFPPGTSMLLYPFVKWGGRAAAFYVLPALNLILILLFFYLGARTVNVSFGLLLAASAFFNVHVFGNSVLIMSDVPSMALLAVSAFCLYRQIQAPRRIFPFLAGVCFGFAVVVRYSNLAGALPLALLFWARFRRERRWKELFRDLAYFGAGGFLFGVVPLALYTQRLFGTIFRMVYEPLSQSRMGLSNVNTGVLFYLRTLGRTFGLPMLILMGVGLVGCLVRQRRRMTGLVCVSALAAFFAFYMVQSIRHERYLAPAYPFLGVLFALGVLEVTDKVRRSSLLTFVLVAACAAYPLFRTEPTYFKGMKDGEVIARSLGEKIPPQSVVLCDDMSGSVRLYADIPGYRFLWTDLPTLKETLDILQAMDMNVYFFLDSSSAEQYFRSVIASIPGLKDRTRLESQIRGIPLYRVWPDGHKPPREPR
jgi:hypothetical protein